MTVRGRPFKTGYDSRRTAMFKSTPLPTRFWAKVRVAGPNECWEWVGNRTKYGYGLIEVDGRRLPAHRVSLMLAGIPIPDGLWACHRCDNPPCVNPAHLFVGTPQDNTLDGVRKGRIKIPKGRLFQVGYDPRRGPGSRQVAA